MKEFAHTLKGACLSTGVAKLADLASTMQTMVLFLRKLRFELSLQGSESNFDAARAALKEAQELFPKICKELEFMCRQLEAGVTE